MSSSGVVVRALESAQISLKSLREGSVAVVDSRAETFHKNLPKLLMGIVILRVSLQDRFELHDAVSRQGTDPAVSRSVSVTG